MFPESTMPRIRPTNRRILIFAAVFAMVAGSSLAQRTAAEPRVQAASIGHGITLHYVDEGTGVPVIFVHGSLSDSGYWAGQIKPFAKHYRAIAYSRRYNYPNTNPARRGYSAVVDSDDLAAFIDTLHLGKVVVIGHSYGALTALFLAARHPELVRALVLAEPPAYVFNDPHAWDKMPQSSRDETLRDAHEWDVMMTTGTLFPAITPRAIRSIST